jgi:Mor family transcriptional regulator
MNHVFVVLIISSSDLPKNVIILGGRATMRYQKGKLIFPEELLQEIQKYVQGELVYIPNRKGSRKRWGESSGSRKLLNQRNDDIRRKFIQGETIDQLTQQYCLSHESIKKIVYSKQV